jgi:hypothetical protein
VRKHEKIAQKAKTKRKNSESKRNVWRLERKRCDLKICRVPVQKTELQASGPKRRTIRTLHTENLKLEENLQKNIFSKK